MNNCVFISGWAHGRSPMTALAAALGHPEAPVWSLADLDCGKGNCPDYASEASSRLDAVTGHSVLVGWSTGAIVALETTIRWPEKIAGLVLISGTPRFCPGPDFPWTGAEAELRAMILMIHRRFEETVADFMQRAAWPQHLNSKSLQPLLTEATEQGVSTLQRGLTYLRQVDCRAELAKLSCPCLIMHGGKDRIVPCPAAAWMSSQINNARLQTWPESGHNLIQQHALELAEEINLFLEKIL